MSELIEMLSVDGYAAGKIVSVRLDGNTNVNGINASGKTTLIKMTPAFYAVAPSTLQRQDANRRSFAEYYLPNATSYLAFVYERDGKFITVVITRKSGSSSLVYRFVQGRCLESCFLQTTFGKPNFVLSSNWRTHMSLAGYEVSRSVGYDDYRLIIQSSLRYTSSDRKKAELINNYRRLYSYPTNGRDMSNIHLLASAVLQRKPSMAAIKSILESVLINQGFIDNGEFGLNLPTKKVDDWIENRNAYLLVDEQRSNIIDLVDKHDSYEGICARLSEIKNLAHRRKEKLQEEQESLTGKLQKCSSDITNYSEQEQAVRTDAGAEIQRITKKRTEQQEIAQVLEQKKMMFESQNIPEKQALAKRVGELRDLHQQAEQHFYKLERGVSDLTQFYEKALANAESEARSKQSQLTEQRKGYELAHEQSLREEEQKLSQIRADIGRQLNKSQSEVHQQIQKLSSNIGKITGQLENVAPSSEITEQLESLRKERKLAEFNVENTRQDLDAAREELKRAEIVCEKCIAEQRRLQDAMNQTEEALNQAREHFAPKDGSLLSFLRGNVPGWSENIAKVIDPDLLLRSDLHPRLIDGAHALYGVGLDVSGIEVPEFACDQALQVEIQRLDEKLAQLHTDCETHKKIAGLRQKEHSQATKNVEREKYNLKSCQSQLAEANKDIDELNIQAEQYIVKRREAFEKEKAHLDEQMRAQQARNNHLHKEAEKALADLGKRHNECVATAKEQLTEQLKLTDAEINAAVEALELRKSELREEEAAQMRERGIDEVALGRARQKAQDASSEYMDAKSAITFINRYDEFMKEQWPEYERLSIQLTELNAEIQELKNKRDQTLGEIQVVIHTLTSEKEEVDDQLSKVNDDLIMLDNNLARMGSIELPDSAPQLTTMHSVMYLMQRWQDQYREVKELRATGRELFEKVRRAFTRNERSRPFEFYQRLSSEMRDTNKRWETEDLWAVAAPHLLEYLNNAHKNNADLLRDSAKMLGQNLSDFSAQLERVHKQVKTLGNQVTGQTETICSDFEALDKLSVKVFSNMDKLDYYTSLRSFAQIHNDWIATNLDSLPNDEYLHRLDGIKNMIEKSGLTVKVQDSFGIEVRIIDQGIEKIARRDKDMDGISSNGVSYLIIILIYNALVNLLRGGAEDILVWPIDELKDFDLNNTRALIGQLNGDNIRIFSAFPDPDPAVLRYFQHLYQAKGRKGSNKRKLVRFAEVDVPSATDDLKSIMTTPKPNN
ncbi:ATP-binding protein [Endozoicomonas ascidiicola]|uniref:ATP-binding protein n=1 Tax=Endozoicomonas ascidiicola TaxID=1698521 RepID=UPI000834EF36|nr:ATP-binding protein [Endozoicomonas ascidiicola]